MIMGASHITLCCSDIDFAIGSMRRRGYQPDFVDHDVLNHPSKRGILQGWSDRHAISMLRAKSGIPIELVSYPVERSPSRGRYIGLFKVSEIELAACEELEVAATALTDHGLPCKAGRFQDLNLPVLFAAGSEGAPGLERLVLPVTDIGRAQAFWCDGLGFRCAHAISGVAHLTLASPVAAWCLAVTLVRIDVWNDRPPLNADGMACLAFLSSNIDDDIARLALEGAESGTEQFRIVVNNRKLCVAIVGFDGAYIELLRILP